MTCELSLQTTGKESSLVQMVNNSLSILLHIIISCFSDIYCSVIYLADNELFSCVKPTLEECRQKRDEWLIQKQRKSL